MKKRFLFLFLISGLVLMNACQRERSLENGNDPSEGTLQDDGAGDCLPKTVSGAYVVGVVLGVSNYIEVQVNVTKAGTYTIYTDTVNGIYFRVSGVFSTTGLITVRLTGHGTPAAIGISNFVVNYGTSGCTIAVPTVGSLGVFTLDGAPGGCMGASVAGTYTAGTALTASNNVTINVNVTTAGAYNLSSTLSNGMTFSGSGVFPVTGPAAIVLTGTGTPISSGSTNVPLTVGTSSCSFSVTVGGAAGSATYTIKCATPPVVNGTYTVGTALTAANTVVITVDVATAGTYSISGTINGMTFTSAAGASFAAAGAGQSVTLNATGTPTTAGANTVSLTGGTASCNIVVNVNPAAGGAAVFTINCATAVINGTYTVGTALNASNTITVTANVTTAGTYSITGTVNGMTFSSAAGASFAAAGAGQLVTLTGTGTPTTAGANSVSLTGATAACSVNVNVVGGGAVFTVNCATPTIAGTYTHNTALNASNTITLSVNVATAGTYNISTTVTNGMTFSATGTWAVGTQTLILTGSGTPNASGTIYIPITAGTTPCNFLLLVAAPAAASDYFPRTSGSNWSYELDNVASDSSITKVIPQTHTALGNVYNVFMSNDGGGFDTSFYARKAGNDYYHYVDLAGYLGLDNTQRVEFIFIKDNQATGATWTTTAWTNAAGGTPLSIRIRFVITNANATVPITSSMGTITYTNTIIVEEHYEANLGTGFISLDNIIGFYRDYYSKNVGWIKDEYIDDIGALSGELKVRRYIVY